MTPFITGFMKYAEEYGVPFDKALHMLKRAGDHPGAADLFKTLDSEQAAQQEAAEDLPSLAELFQQDLINQQMDAAKRKISLT